MSTYDDNLSTTRDQLRFLIGDTDDNEQMLSDSEIAFLFTMEDDDLLMTCASACDAIASKFARDVNFRFCTMWQDASDAKKHYTELANRFRAETSRNTAQPVFTFNENLNAGEVWEQFWYGMHDNPQTYSTDS